MAAFDSASLPRSARSRLRKIPERLPIISAMAASDQPPHCSEPNGSGSATAPKSGVSGPAKNGGFAKDRNASSDREGAKGASTDIRHTSPIKSFQVASRCRVRVGIPSDGSVLPSKTLGSLPAFPEELRSSLSSCSRRTDHSLSRGEMAAIFLVSRRTINRWEAAYGIPAQRKNARVLRYPLESVVRLVAFGQEIDTEKAEGLALFPKPILALAACVATQTKSARKVLSDQPVTLAVEDDDERRLIIAWRNAEVGPTLRKIVRALTEDLVTAID